MEVGNIFSKLELVEQDIHVLQEKEEKEGGLQEADLHSLHHHLSMHHALLN